MDVTEICEEYQEEVRSYLKYKFPEHSDEYIDITAHGITHMFINAVNYVLGELLGENGD